MRHECKAPSIIIIGATGGLGSAFARFFSKKGARLLLAGRDEAKLRDVQEGLTGDITIATMDLSDAQTVENLSRIAGAWSPTLDIVINATGTDRRKSLDDHSIEDIQDLIDTNLKGTILITKAFLPHMRNEKGSTIVHIGGFADGRIAFPYYSVDVATRAGVFSFTEAINRELETEGKATRVTYFCPSPAETEAETPFHSLWKEMGIPVVSVENVAKELDKTIRHKRTIGIMGGLTTVLFAKINSVLPRLTDVIIMRKYGRMLKNFLYGDKENPQKSSNKSLLNKVAIVLVILSFLLYGLIAVVPFVPLSLAQKAALIPVLVVGGEAVWWIGIAIVGKQAISKYRAYLNPCKWIGCIRGKG